MTTNYHNNHPTMSTLVDEALFIKKAELSADGKVPNIDSASLENSSNEDLLNLTYKLLRADNLDKAEALTLWELRLVLLMFGNQLGVAKREAINLNNALYLQENPNAPPPPAPPQPPLTRTDSAASQRSASPAVPSAQGVIYPLLKNNDGAIGFPLLLLILRLKLAPNLSLVNELYKLCYQLRLKGVAREEDEIRRNLVNLSYEIIMVLTITRNFQTLLSFLGSLETDLNAMEDKSQNDHKRYASNVSLMIVLAHMLILQGEEAIKLDRADLRQRYADLDKFTIDCFHHILKSFPPMVSEGNVPSVGSDEEISYDKLIQLVKGGKLTGRITCCTLASFQLGNMFGADFESTLGSKQLVANVGPLESRFGDFYSKVMSQWGSYIHKLYGIE